MLGQFLVSYFFILAMDLPMQFFRRLIPVYQSIQNMKRRAEFRKFNRPLPQTIRYKELPTIETTDRSRPFSPISHAQANPDRHANLVSQTVNTVLEKVKESAEGIQEQAKELVSDAAKKADQVATSADRGLEKMAEGIRQHTPSEGVIGDASHQFVSSLRSTGNYLEKHGVNDGMVQVGHDFGAVNVKANGGLIINPTTMGNSVLNASDVQKIVYESSNYLGSVNLAAVDQAFANLYEFDATVGANIQWGSSFSNPIDTGGYTSSDSFSGIVETYTLSPAPPVTTDPSLLVNGTHTLTAPDGSHWTITSQPGTITQPSDVNRLQFSLDGDNHLIASTSGNGTITIETVSGITAGTILNNGSPTTIINCDLGSVNISSGNSIIVNADQHLRSLVISDAGVTISGNHTITTDSLSVVASGTLDIGHGAVIVNYSDTSPSDQLVTQVVKATAPNLFEEFTWTGSGITSSLAASDPSRFVVAIGDNSDLGLTSFRGHAVAPNAVIITATYAGDTNFDGQVNSDDSQAIDFNIGTTLAHPSYAQGDINYNGTVDSDDQQLLDFGILSPTGPVALPIPPMTIDQVSDRVVIHLRDYFSDPLYATENLSVSVISNNHPTLLTTVYNASSGNLTVIQSPGQFGNGAITLSAMNPDGLTTSVVVNVTAPFHFDAEVSLVGTLPTGVVTDGDLLTVDYSVTGSTPTVSFNVVAGYNTLTSGVTLSLVNPPTGVSFNATTGVVTCVLSEAADVASNDGYWKDITIRARNVLAGLDISHTFSIATFGTSNHAPVLQSEVTASGTGITHSGDTVNVDYAVAGATPTVSFTIHVTDPDVAVPVTNSFTFTLDNAPTGATLVNNHDGTATITWHAHERTDGQGEQYFEVSVTDNGITQLSDYYVYTVKTTGTSNNHQPQLIAAVTTPTNMPTQPGVSVDPEHADTILVDKYFAGNHPTVSFRVHATDADAGDTLTFEWPGMPDGATVLPQEDGRSAIVTFTLDETFLTDGVQDVHVFVSDDGATPLMDEHRYHVKLIDTTEQHTPQVDFAPRTSSSTPPEFVNRSGNVDFFRFDDRVPTNPPVTFTVTSNLPPQNAMTFELFGDAHGATISHAAGTNTATITWTGASAAGSTATTFRIRVTNTTTAIHPTNEAEFIIATTHWRSAEPETFHNAMTPSNGNGGVGDTITAVDQDFTVLTSEMHSGGYYGFGNVLHGATFDVAYGRWVGGSPYVSTPGIEFRYAANAPAWFLVDQDGMVSFSPHPGHDFPGETFHCVYRLAWIAASGAWSGIKSEWADIAIHVKNPNLATWDSGAYLVEDRTFTNLATDGTQTQITVGNLAENIYDEYYRPTVPGNYTLHVIDKNGAAVTVSHTSDTDIALAHGMLTVNSLGAMTYTPDGLGTHSPTNSDKLAPEEFQFYVTRYSPTTGQDVRSNNASVKLEFEQVNSIWVSDNAEYGVATDGNSAKVVFHVHLDRPSDSHAESQVEYSIVRETAVDSMWRDVADLNSLSSVVRTGVVSFGMNATEMTVEYGITNDIAVGMSKYTLTLSTNGNVTHAHVDRDHKVSEGFVAHQEMISVKPFEGNASTGTPPTTMPNQPPASGSSTNGGTVQTSAPPGGNNNPEEGWVLVGQQFDQSDTNAQLPITSTQPHWYSQSTMNNHPFVIAVRKRQIEEEAVQMDTLLGLPPNLRQGMRTLGDTALKIMSDEPPERWLDAATEKGIEFLKNGGNPDLIPEFIDFMCNKAEAELKLQENKLNWSIEYHNQLIEKLAADAQAEQDAINKAYSAKRLEEIAYWKLSGMQRYLVDVGQTAKGYFWDGPGEMISGIGHVIAHPIDTGGNLIQAVSHPSDTFDALKKHYEEELKTPGGQGKVGFELVTTILTGGETAANGLTKIQKLASKLKTVAGKTELVAQAAEELKILQVVGKVSEAATVVGEATDIAAVTAKATAAIKRTAALREKLVDAVNKSRQARTLQNADNFATHLGIEAVYQNAYTAVKMAKQNGLSNVNGALGTRAHTIFEQMNNATNAVLQNRGVRIVVEDSRDAAGGFASRGALGSKRLDVFLEVHGNPLRGFDLKTGRLWSAKALAEYERRFGIPVQQIKPGG